MKNILNSKHFAYTSLALVVLISSFYWFQYRPAKIRHDCSWIKQVAPAIPAQPAITKKEVEDSQQQYNKCNAKYPDPDFDSISFIDFTSRIKVKYNPNRKNEFGTYICKDLLKKEQPASPAQAENIWYRPAKDTEYSFCLKDKGL